MLDELIHFFKTGTWKKPFRSWPERWFRCFISALHGFSVDGCELRASALTFYTLFALVPVLALAFGIAQGFDLDALIEKELLDQFVNYKEVVQEIIIFAQNLLASTRGGLIAGFGIVLLIYSVVRMLSQIEDTFNHIWLVKEGRTWQRRVADYLSISWILPLLLLLSSSTFVIMITKAQALTSQVPVIGEYASYWRFWLDIFPFLMTWGLASFFYVFMPNTTVKWSSALFAGFFSAIIYQIFHALYIYFQLKISSYGAIYGSFAALPLFLLLIQIGWMIVLFGGELAFAFQYEGVASAKTEGNPLSEAQQLVIQIALIQLLNRQFKQGKGGLSLMQISQKLNVPAVYIFPLVNQLTETNWVVKSLSGYFPARDYNLYTLNDLIVSLFNCGNPALLAESESLQQAKTHYNEYVQQMQKSATNPLICDL